jgi:hypothetical protein
VFSKSDLLKRLREHPLYKAALTSVDAEQAKKIAAIAESFLGQATEGLAPLIVQATDPATVNEARTVLNDRGLVITQEPKSGSKGT